MREKNETHVFVKLVLYIIYWAFHKYVILMFLFNRAEEFGMFLI